MSNRNFEGFSVDTALKQLSEKKRAWGTVIFNKGTVNVFTDASYSNGFSRSSVTNVIVYTDDDCEDTTYVSDPLPINVETSNDAEFVGLVYAIMQVKERVYEPITKVNIFTDCLALYKFMKPRFDEMNHMFYNETKARFFLQGIMKSKASNGIVTLCGERLGINAPVNIYHIKTHSKNVMMIRSRFEDVNHDSITLGDTIKASMHMNTADRGSNMINSLTKDTLDSIY